MKRAPRIGRPPLVHVPTVAELATEGLARQVAPGYWRLEPEGQRRIYAAMEVNGRRGPVDQEGDADG